VAQRIAVAEEADPIAAVERSIAGSVVGPAGTDFAEGTVEDIAGRSTVVGPGVGSLAGAAGPGSLAVDATVASL
jgi:hypothetical protein